MRREGSKRQGLLRFAIVAVLVVAGAAIGGISMGGFGALDLARQHPDRFCAVGGHSPALWQAAGETPGGAFDDADDFARHDVMSAYLRFYAGALSRCGR